MEQDHYHVLDVPRGASDAEIKRRYRALMRRAHPDANAGDPAATRAAARINAAYEVLGDRERRRAYDAGLPPGSGTRTPGGRRKDGIYAHWAEQENWEDIVAEHVPPKRTAHVHTEPPLIEPEEIDVDATELRLTPRVKRTIAVTNRCDCMLVGDVATSESWVWGPLGHFEVGPGARVEFEIEVVASRVRFPGLSRVLFVTRTWTGVVPVRVQGFETKTRRVVPAAEGAYVRNNRAKRWARKRS